MIRILSLVAILFTLTLPAQAQFADGTWKWSSEMGDRTINSTLYLTTDGEKLSGRYENDTIQQDIEEGNLDGTDLSFQLPVEVNGQSVLVKFQGELKDEGIVGTVRFEVDGQQQGEDYPWQPNRFVGKQEVLGTWSFRYTAPDGVEYTPTLLVAADGDKLSGEMTMDGGAIDLESIRIQDDALIFSCTVPYQGSDLALSYTCHPHGHKMTGMLAYDMDGNGGEFDISATRKHLSAELKKLLGEWEFAVNSDDGVERKPILTLSEKDGELVASLEDEGEAFDLQDIQFEDGELSFNFTRNHDGMNVDIKWSCKPDGDGMQGSLEYNADGNVGEIPITGERKS